MYIDPQWTPVIGEAIRWVKELFTSKREMRLEIEDLSSKINELLYGNAVLAQRQAEILAAVITELRAESAVIVNHGTITIATNVSGLGGEAMSGIQNQRGISIATASNHQPSPIEESSLFDGVDEAIAAARLTRPSERSE